MSAESHVTVRPTLSASILMAEQGASAWTDLWRMKSQDIVKVVQTFNPDS